MPTGYTAPIADGMTFEQFALGCARAFGALVTMRDEPNDAPIPERFEPSDYHQKKLQETQAELDRINAMSAVELTECAFADHRAEVQTCNDYIAKEAALLGKYEAMLAKVNAWAPPTSDHVGMKDFMVEQITSSIKFDCGSTYWHKQIAALGDPTPDAWKSKRIAKLQRDLAYHEDEHRKEVERAHMRTQWIKALRDSLA
jgi:hypothetical protein